MNGKSSPLLNPDLPIAVINISFPTLNDSANNAIINDLLGNPKKGALMADQQLLNLLSSKSIGNSSSNENQKSNAHGAQFNQISHTINSKDTHVTSPFASAQIEPTQPAPVITTMTNDNEAITRKPPDEQQPKTISPLVKPPLEESLNQQKQSQNKSLLHIQKSTTNATETVTNISNTIPSKTNTHPNFSTDKITTTAISVDKNPETGKHNVEFSSSENLPKIDTPDDIECYNASDGTVKCRSKLGHLHPHISASQFSGNIGIKEKGRNGTRVIGGETNNKMNETMNFKVGKSRYDFQNLTNFHNCSGCLKNKKLIKHNTTRPIQLNRNKTQTLKQGKQFKSNQTANFNNQTKTEQAQTDEGLSDISKLRNRLRNSKNNTNFPVRNISRPASNHRLPPTKFKPVNMTKNRNKTSTREYVQTKCEEVDTKRSGIGNDLVKTGVILSCISKRRLVATKHTKTKKNGKVVEDSKKPSNNTERAQQNEENAKSNEERKHQSDGNNESNMKQSVSNEKVLQDILNGVHGKPAKDFTPEENRNIENKTITLDPSIVTNHEVHEGRIPDAEHRDEDVGIMGVDDHPAIETNLTKPEESRNKTSYVWETVSEEKPAKNGTSVDKAKEITEDDQNDHEIKAKEKPTMHDNKKLQKKPYSEHTTNNSNSTISELHNVTDTHKTLNKTNLHASEVGSALSQNNTVNSSFVATKANETIDDSRSENEEENKEPTKRILAFGDSLTKGLFSKNRYNPYSRHLLELLQKDDTNNTKYKIFEEGVNGECACNAMAKRLPEELEFHKNIDLVIIIAGTNDLLKNDCLNKCDLFKAIKRLHEIAHRKKAATVLTTILESTFTPAKMSTKDYKTVLSDVNQQIRGYGQQEEKSKKLKLCDIADELPRKAPLSLDRIHPTREGYDQLAEIIYNCLKDFTY